MAKPLYTITKPVSVGIWDNEEYVARIYRDKIIVETPIVRWVNNSGNLHISKNAIRREACIKAVLRAMEDDCEDDAFDLIGAELCDPYLSNY